MKRLTKAQLERLPVRAQDLYEFWRGHKARPQLVWLCTELAHALEQVAAAKLMAEALEAYQNLKADCVISSARPEYDAYRARVHSRYWRLVDVKFGQALAAWNEASND